MPQRTRVRLLAGIAAFLSLCAGGVGCQTSSVHMDGYTTRPGVVSRSWLSFFRRPDPGPATLDPAPEGTVIAASSPVAVLARPTGAAAPPLGAVASVWEPVQHVPVDNSTGAPATTGVARVSAPVGQGSAMRASIDLPGAPPLTIASTSAPNDPPASPDKPEQTDKPAPPAQLSQPRLEPMPVAVIAPPVFAHPNAPREFAKQPLPPYVVEPPDVLLIQATKAASLEGESPIEGQHLVRPDGTISLGTYGSVYVAGLTLDEARNAVAAQLQTLQPKKTVEEIRKGVVVDVLAYNSKVYYVITDGAGYGQSVYPIPVTGNETVLDAIGKINGLPAVANPKRIWVARATPSDCTHPEILPVDWCGITKRGSAATNYQIFPNDRIYVASDPYLQTESWLSKRLNIVDRLFSTVLLSSTTINSIKNRGIGNGAGR